MYYCSNDDRLKVETGQPLNSHDVLMICLFLLYCNLFIHNFQIKEERVWRQYTTKGCIDHGVTTGWILCT